MSVRGRARVIREHMQCDEQYAILEIDVEQVKNDRVRTLVIESAITITACLESRSWFETRLGEMETSH